MNARTSLLIILSFVAFRANAQQPEPAALTEQQCNTKEEMLNPPSQIIMREMRPKKGEPVEFLIPLKTSDQQNSPSTKFKLKNLTNNTILSAEADDTQLKFKMAQAPGGVSEVYYQLVDNTGKCYNMAYKLTINTEVPNAGNPIPPLTIKTEIPARPNCESCEDPARKVQYDFNTNEVNTIWPDTTARLYTRFWRGLPWVGREYTFEVINVNPFRYDITIADEKVTFVTELPTGLVDAFTMPAGIKAAAAGTDSAALAKALVGLGDQLNATVSALQNAGDCLNPCEIVVKINEEIIAYFTDNFQYKASEQTLESFFIKKLNLSQEPTEKNKETLKKLNDIVRAYFAFRNTGSGTVRYHIPQTQNVDQYLFNLKIMPKEGVTTGARVVNQDIRVDVLGGFRADASTGLFFTELIDDKYSLYPDSIEVDGDMVARTKVVKEKGNSSDFGIASLLHFYPRLTKSVSIGASLGAGVTLNEKPKLRYLAGATALLGRGNRIAITYGWAMGYIDKVSDKYTREAGNIYGPASESTVSYKKIFHSKPFFSITYNIPLGKKTETANSGSSSGGGGNAKTGGDDKKEEEGNADGKKEEKEDDEKKPDK